jgi:hypothetical protein
MLSFFLVSNTFGLDYRVNSKLYNHLFEINKNWQLHQNEVPNELISFHSDRERIQMHLLLVEKSLRNTHSGKRTAQQNQNRATSLDILHTYALAGKFPINTGHKTRQPYFIDNFGTHCAVGFLVKETGFPEISKAISETQNFAYVKEIVSPELVQWSREYGFTLEELAWIQPSYAPTQTYAQVGGGTNGRVTCSKSKNGRLYFGGNFTELDSLPCLNVGYFSNDQLHCFGNGIAGKVIGIAEFGTNGVIVGGEFESGGVTYPMAKYDGNIWTYQEIPGVPNARATSFQSDINGLDIKIAVSAPSIQNGQEIWYFMGGWSQIAFVPGIIYDMDFSYQTILAGHFDSIQIINSAPYWVEAKNFVVANGSTWSSAVDWVPDTVFSILSQGNTLYVGGSAGSSANGTALMRFLNGVAQPLLTNSTYPPIMVAPLCVYDLLQSTNSSLIIGGDLKIYTNWGTYGQNLFTYDLANSTLIPLAILDSTVQTIAEFENKFYFGGDFTYNGYDPAFSPPLNHLIYLDGNLGIQEQMSALQLAIFPNPSKGNLSIQGIDEERIQSIEILDLQGKICHESKTTELDLAHLRSGTYLVRVVATDGSSTIKKWVKE